jgi:hypothetical protein
MTFPWPPNETGPCGSCRQPHRRYGPQGRPLCSTCDPEPCISSPETPSASKAPAVIREPAPRPRAGLEPDQLELSLS